MSLREQLVKAGLASENQAKKSARALDKIKHDKKVQERLKTSDQTFTEAEAFEKRDDDKQKEWESKVQKEKDAVHQKNHLEDLILRSALFDPAAKLIYNFTKQDGQIEGIVVNELQKMQLAAGDLAIAYSDRESRYVLVSKESAAKISRLSSRAIVCFHGS